MKVKKFIAIISIVCILAVILCIPAFATVTESDGDGYSLYNGLRLPALPIVGDYDYATLYYSNISDSDVVGSASLWLTTMHLYRSIAPNGISTVFKASEAGSVIKYNLSTDGGSYSWTLSFTREYNANTSVITETGNVQWSNYDILYYGMAGATDGSVYRSASQSISLDGYNIIQWDGDTSGLVEVLTDCYRLAPYQFATDAFAVWRGDTRTVQSAYVANDPVWLILASSATGTDDGTPIVVGNDGTEVDDVVLDGIVSAKYGDYFTPLIAYRTVESPPGEGGDTPDEPQPPLWAAEIYLKLHLLALTPQLK